MLDRGRDARDRRPDGSIEDVNDTWEEVLGWRRDELIGRSFFEYIHPDDAAATLAEMAKPQTREHGVGRFENRYRTQDGGWRNLCWRVELVDGRWLAVAEDITQRLTLERDVLRDPLTGVLNRAACPTAAQPRKIAVCASVRRSRMPASRYSSRTTR